MKRIFFYILLASLVYSCKPKQNMVYASQQDSEAIISEAKFNGLTIHEGDQLLILVSALDEIAVRPFNLNTMNKTNSEVVGTGNMYAQPSEYIVNSNGTIQFPELGEIPVKGITHVQLKEELESRLRKYLKDPMVTVSVKNFSISVLGEVKSPGLFKSENQKVNIFQGLAMAGDMTEYREEMILYR